MAKNNWPCEEKFPSGRICEGEMILIDGDADKTRMRCNKCNKVEILPISLDRVKKILRDYGAGI